MGRRLLADFLSGDKGYNFLLDRNVEHLVRFFPNAKKRVRTVSQEGLPSAAPDRDIVERAWLRQSTIVTADIKDFRPAIGRFHKRRGRNPCGCVFGLIVLPNVHETQKRLLRNHLRALEAQLRLNGEQITWKDVHLKNYMVRVMKKGSPQITELPMCVDCAEERTKKKKSS